MNEDMGYVFNIQKFCTNDGPGIRTAVFLKGCPLNCMWCHNPESKKKSPELSYNSDKCTLCGACGESCTHGVHSFEGGAHILKRGECIMCGKCEEACAAGALEIIGRKMSAKEVIKEVLKDKPFYRNEGGVTISGGEPFYQFDFLMSLLKLAKENGINTCVETSGFTSNKNIMEASKLIDLFLYDYKLSDTKKHKFYTGVPNEGIINNLTSIDEAGKKIILRCPIIPGVNDDYEHIRGISSIANSLKCLVRIELMAYHSLGESKARNTGAEYPMKDAPHMSEEDIASVISRLSQLVEVPVKRG